MTSIILILIFCASLIGVIRSADIFVDRIVISGGHLEYPR